MNVFKSIKKGLDAASNAQLLADENVQLSVAAERHEHLREQVQRDTEALFKQRQRSVPVIEIVETYVNHWRIRRQNSKRPLRTSNCRRIDFEKMC